MSSDWCHKQCCLTCLTSQISHDVVLQTTTNTVIVFALWLDGGFVKDPQAVVWVLLLSWPLFQLSHLVFVSLPVILYCRLNCTWGVLLLSYMTLKLEATEMEGWLYLRKGVDIGILIMFECCFCFWQVYGGMRGMKGLVYETSVLDPDEVIMHIHTIPWNVA